MAETYRLQVNGSGRAVTVEPETPLLYVLRNDLELNGPRFGCGLSQCGACTVLIEGKPARFIEEQAAQCGYCANGMIMTAKALLDRTPHPTEAQVKKALAANLCRCGTHNRIVRAVRRASKGKGVPA